MQLVGSELFLRPLRDRAVGGRRHQLRRHRRRQHVAQHLRLGARRLVLRHPAHQLAHQRLGHARVHVVHGDVVAVEGRPAERDLREVAGAHLERAVQVREVHQDLRALAGLQVLVGHALAVLRVEPDVRDVLQAGGLDVDLAQRGAERRAQLPRVLERAPAGAEAGHGDGQDTGARQLQQVERAHAHQQRQGRVEPAREAERDLREAGVLQPAREAGRLDREDLLAAVVERRRVARYERRRIDRPQQAVRLGGRDLLDVDPVVAPGDVVGRVRERGEARALHLQALDVDVRRQELALAPEALALGQDRPVLRDQELPPEDDVGRGLVHTAVRVDVPAHPAGRLHLHQLAPELRLRHQLVRRRRAEDDGGAGGRVAGGRRHRRPQVLADLDRDRHARLVRDLEQHVGAERHVLSAQAQLLAHRLAGRGEPALLVVLAIARQVRLGHDPQQAPRLDHGRAVEEPPLGGDRQPDHGEHR